MACRINHRSAESAQIYARIRRHRSNSSVGSLTQQRTVENSGLLEPSTGTESGNITYSLSDVDTSQQSTTMRHTDATFPSADSVRSNSQWESSEVGSEESRIPMQDVASDTSTALIQASWQPDQELSQTVDAFDQRDMNIQFDQLIDLSFLEYQGDIAPELLSPRWADMSSGHLIFSPNPFLRTPKAFSASSFENNSTSTANDHLWKELDETRWANRLDEIVRLQVAVSRNILFG